MDSPTLEELFKGNPDLARANPELTGQPETKRRRGKPEDIFQQQIITYAKQNGWRVAHFRTVRIQRKDGSVYYATPVQADGEGFPDLLLVRERMMVVEVKSDTGKLSDKQRVWLKAFHVAGVEWHVWNPVDWPEIEEALRR